MNRHIHLREQWWDESEPGDRDYIQQQIRDALQQGEVKITFIKADGTRREMLATVSSNIVPATVTESTRAPREPNPNVCHVWDIEAQGWRSFRWDRLRAADFTG